MNENELPRIAEQLTRIADALDRLGGPAPQATDFAAAIAFRWRNNTRAAWLDAVHHPATLRLNDLKCIERQKQALSRNTLQFVQRLPANNALLWGSRGTGKSSLIRALLNEYHDAGLRLIEVEKHDLTDLPSIVDCVHGRTERFVIYCDDLSFEANDPSYKALKVVLDGSVSAPPDNVLIYATSNRRHLMPESMQENLEAQHIQGEIHPGETTEEKISLSERFGIWVSFHPFKQDDYLDIVDHWLTQMGVSSSSEQLTEWRAEALRWALARGSRSGRVAWQFARDWAGRAGLQL